MSQNQTNIVDLHLLQIFFHIFILDSPSLLQSPINGDLTGKEKPFIKKTLAQNRKDSAENSPTAGKINGLKVWYNSKQCENS